MKYSINKRYKSFSFIIVFAVIFAFMTGLTACGVSKTSAEKAQEVSANEQNNSTDTARGESVSLLTIEDEDYSQEPESTENHFVNDYYLSRTDEIYTSYEVIEDFNENGDLVGTHEYMDGKLLAGFTYKYDLHGMLYEMYDDKYDHLFRIESNRIDSNTVEQIYYDDSSAATRRVLMAYGSDGKKEKETVYKVTDGEYKIYLVTDYDYMENPIDRVVYIDIVDEGYWERTVFENAYESDLLVKTVYYVSNAREPELKKSDCNCYSYLFDANGNIAEQSIYNYDEDEPVPANMTDAIQEDHLVGHCYYTFLKRNG